MMDARHWSLFICYSESGCDTACHIKLLINYRFLCIGGVHLYVYAENKGNKYRRPFTYAGRELRHDCYDQLSVTGHFDNGRSYLLPLQIVLTDYCSVKSGTYFPDSLHRYKITN